MHSRKQGIQMCIKSHFFTVIFSVAAGRRGRGKLGRQESGAQPPRQGFYSASSRDWISARTAGVSWYSCSSQASVLG